MIQIIATGGTIDKVYNPLSGDLEFTQSYIAEILTTARVKLKYHIETLFMKDSLKMTIDDRAKIVDFCKHSKCDKIIISHGTDTMVETAKSLTEITDKTIVLFGAIVPFSIQNSDSVFNLSAAFSSAQTLKNGVYITMNGKIFTANHVVKNYTTGIFEAL